MRQYTEHKAGDLIIDSVDMRTPLLALPKTRRVPYKADYDAYVLPPSNQLSDPSCAGFQAAGLAEFIRWRKYDEYEQIPGLPLYQDAKKNDGFDGPGTFLRHALKALQNLGYLPTSWIQQRIENLADLKYVMHRRGYIVLCGMEITEGWNNADTQTGAIDETLTEKIGGHAWLITSYNEREDFYRGPNCWGLEHGDKGFVQMSHKACDAQFMTGMILRAPDQEGE